MLITNPASRYRFWRLCYCKPFLACALSAARVAICNDLVESEAPLSALDFSRYFGLAVVLLRCNGGEILFEKF